jgi:DNA-binding MarR family transcriptional regulator
MKMDTSRQPGSAEARELTDVVNQLRRVLRSGIRTEFTWESLPMAQVELMQSLADGPPARVHDIADRLHLAQSTVSGLVGHMMSSGLVTRDVDPADRRAAVVSLSDAGRRQLEAWERAHVQRIQAALARVDPGDRGAIAAALPALRRLTSALIEG